MKIKVKKINNSLYEIVYGNRTFVGIPDHIRTAGLDKHGFETDPVIDGCADGEYETSYIYTDSVFADKDRSVEILHDRIHIYKGKTKIDIRMHKETKVRK